MSFGVHFLISWIADEGEGVASSKILVGAKEGDAEDALVGTCVFIGRIIPGIGSDMPGFGNDMPGFGSDIPGKGNDMPGLGNDMPGYGNDMPGFGNDMPGYGTDMPDSFPKEVSCRYRMWANLNSCKLKETENQSSECISEYQLICACFTPSDND